MKFLVSSRALSRHLNEIDFREDFVLQLILQNKKSLIIKTKEKCIHLDVEATESKFMIVRQDGRRWDWIKKLLSQVDEQPIVIEANENVTNVIFQH